MDCGNNWALGQVGGSDSDFYITTEKQNINFWVSGNKCLNFHSDVHVFSCLYFTFRSVNEILSDFVPVH